MSNIILDMPGGTMEQTLRQSYLVAQAQRLLHEAEATGHNLTIERQSVEPFAQGNVVLLVSVWPKIERKG